MMTREESKPTISSHRRLLRGRSLLHEHLALQRDHMVLRSRRGWLLRHGSSEVLVGRRRGQRHPPAAVHVGEFYIVLAADNRAEPDAYRLHRQRQ